MREIALKPEQSVYDVLYCLVLGGSRSIEKGSKIIPYGARSCSRSDLVGG